MDRSSVPFSPLYSSLFSSFPSLWLASTSSSPSPLYSPLCHPSAAIFLSLLSLFLHSLECLPFFHFKSVALRSLTDSNSRRSHPKPFSRHSTIRWFLWMRKKWLRIPPVGCRRRCCVVHTPGASHRIPLPSSTSLFPPPLFSVCALYLCPSLPPFSFLRQTHASTSHLDGRIAGHRSVAAQVYHPCAISTSGVHYSPSSRSHIPDMQSRLTHP